MFIPEIHMSALQKLENVEKLGQSNTAPSVVLQVIRQTDVQDQNHLPTSRSLLTLTHLIHFARSETKMETQI